MASAATGIRADVNFSGVSNFMVSNFRWVDTSAITSTSAKQNQGDVGSGGTSGTTQGSIMSSWSRRAGNTVGIAQTLVDTANADMLLMIEGQLDVQVEGNLELWAGRGGATVANLTIRAGSVLWVELTAF
jgi:hypothetical protein